MWPNVMLITLLECNLAYIAQHCFCKSACVCDDDDDDDDNGDDYDDDDDNDEAG